jgi:small conductance mechanosensitive channel
MARVAVLILMLSILSPLVAEAQAPGEAVVDAALPDSVIGLHAAGLMRDALDELAAIERFRQRLLVASAEDSVVLNMQLFAAQQRGMEDLYDLVDALVELESRGEQPDLRARLEDGFAMVTPSIWRIIGDLEARVDGLRARRPTTAPADREALEDRIDRATEQLDAMYGLAWQHVDHMRELGMDPAADSATFAVLVSARAENLSGRIALSMVRADELAHRLKDNPGDADTAALGRAVARAMAADAASQRHVLDIMDAMGLPTGEYRAQLVTATQDFVSGLLDARVMARLLQGTWTRVAAWFTDSGPRVLLKMVAVVVIMLLGWLAARVARRATARALDSTRANISQLLRRTLVKLAFNAVMALATMIALSQLGINLGPIFAGLGVVGFILGFAMQDSLSNLASGMMILIYRPYDVGDLVDIAGAFGRVENMSMVSTSILTLDNQKLVVPNSKIWGDVIKNVTDQHVRRVDMVFGISYSDDIAKAERILNAILAENPRVLDDPEPMVRLHSLGESSVDFVVRPWVRTDDYWEVHWEVTREVKVRFDAEGVSIPFPQRDVHLYDPRAVLPRIEEPLRPVGRSDWSGETEPEDGGDDD